MTIFLISGITGSKNQKRKDFKNFVKHNTKDSYQIPREKRKEGTGSLFKEITLQIFPDLKKTLDIQPRNAKRTAI